MLSSCAQHTKGDDDNVATLCLKMGRLFNQSKIKICDLMAVQKLFD